MHLSRFLLLLFLLAAIPSLAFAESDIQGWGKAKWGMLYSEVKKLYELNPWESGGTPVSKMKKKIKIMGRDFAIAFYFDERSASGKLYKIALAHFDTSRTDSSWLQSIRNILVEKYGNPTLFDIKDKMRVSLWKKSTGQLRLTTLSGETVMCAIEYFSAITESEKL